MRRIILYLLVLISSVSYSQNTLEKLLKQYNDNGVPYISAEELAMPKTKDVILLDSREPKEFNVSHLKGAICVGYDNFNLDSVTTQLPNKNQKIVVYCSLGIRSETIAERLKAVGYTNVENLYGGIFEWKNKNFSVYNTSNKETDSIHTFNKDWSKWLKKGIKVYEKEVAEKK
ncbi:rhodanese-like domain-containing protein [uncultured Lacinutrix sp.]|uniref:rhodanese-like domain-containing protein n=1 Tax=uncultured Lacinutrix sp. TaxID=574032 RepID=UPI002625ECD4|nr:rhodanese-like domain-containing protein [uncultured Lacinutrix sp.]